MSKRQRILLVAICALQIMGCIEPILAKDLQEGTQDPEFGPSADSVTVTEGQAIYLDCLVWRRGDKMLSKKNFYESTGNSTDFTKPENGKVTWSRRHHDGHIELITYGRSSFHDDRRYNLSYEPNWNWRLRLIAARETDEGIYECQVATHPPMKKTVFLKVIDPQIKIIDTKGDHFQDEIYILMGSSVSFTCVMTPLSVYIKKVSFWIHNERRVNNSQRTSLYEKRGENNFVVVYTIKEVWPSDQGNLVCKSKGHKGKQLIIHVFQNETSSAVHSTGGEIFRIFIWQILYFKFIVF